jgi:hypothetical protein
MSETPEIQEDLGVGGRTKNWFQDNVRIILSVLIVVAIAAGIYSYSKRTDEELVQEEAMIEEMNDELTAMETEEAETPVTIIGENEETAEPVKSEETESVTEEIKEVPVAEEVQVPVTKIEETDTNISEESEEAFIETAVAGDSKTTLARKALRNYLEKNNDSSLTAEHKIYIEDYLRKNVALNTGVNPGTTVSFSKNLIQDSIEKAKTLSEGQLKNLEKYSQRVSNL